MVPSVAIIILNWNSFKDTFECIKSLEKITYRNFHVFLVDNLSKDNSYVELKNAISDGDFNVQISLLQSGGNLGFAGGNNVAVKLAYEQGFDYIWLLNNDTIAEQDSLDHLINAISGDNKIGIVGSKIYYHGSQKIWFAGGKINKLTGNTSHIGFREEDIKGMKYSKLTEVDYITGCSLLFHRKLIEKIGLMKEDYFMYYEEVDWNIRSQQLGLSTVIEPKSVIHHKVSMSLGGENNISPMVSYYCIRNSFVMYRKLKIGYFLLPYINLVNNISKNIIKILVKNQTEKFKRIKLILKGARDGICNNMGVY